MIALNSLLKIACDATRCGVTTARGESRRRKAVYARVIFLLLAREQGYRDYVILWHIGRSSPMAVHYTRHLDYYRESATFNKSLLKARNYVANFQSL